jgi:hypothetical protein
MSTVQEKVEIYIQEDMDVQNVPGLLPPWAKKWGYKRLV